MSLQNKMLWFTKIFHFLQEKWSEHGLGHLLCELREAE